MEAKGGESVVEPEPTLTPFEHTFDYGKTVEQLLEEGAYDDYVVRATITQEICSVAERGVVKRKGDYLHFGKDMTDTAVDAWCEKHNKRRATAHETLTIGAADKELQRKYPVVSGQTARIGGGRLVVFLIEDDRQRRVVLCQFGRGNGWGPPCRFVVFDR